MAIGPFALERVAETCPQNISPGQLTCSFIQSVDTFTRTHAVRHWHDHNMSTFTLQFVTPVPLITNDFFAGHSVISRQETPFRALARFIACFSDILPAETMVNEMVRNSYATELATVDGYATADDYLAQNSVHPIYADGLYLGEGHQLVSDDGSVFSYWIQTTRWEIQPQLPVSQETGQTMHQTPDQGTDAPTKVEPTQSPASHSTGATSYPQQTTGVQVKKESIDASEFSAKLRELRPKPSVALSDATFDTSSTAAEEKSHVDAVSPMPPPAQPADTPTSRRESKGKGKRKEVKVKVEEQEQVKEREGEQGKSSKKTDRSVKRKKRWEEFKKSRGSNF